MIIHQPEIKIVEGDVIVSSRVETIAKTPLPKNLWFKYPLEYKEAVSDRTEAFFTTLFLLGMHLKEDIEIRGDVSPKLVHNIDEMSSIYLKGNEKSFSRINYRFDSITVAYQNLKRGIKLSSFSGGIDSFYAFWSHLFPKQSDHPVQLTHGLFILGFDLLLQNANNYNKLFNNYQKLFNEWGLSLIQCSTNAYSFYQFRFPWGLALKPTLAGIATSLGNQVSNYYLPSNFKIKLENPSNPASCIHLLSTDTIEIGGHGNGFNRPTKIRKIIDWAPAQNHLRVCLNMNNEEGVYACQNCLKCWNTSLMLYLNDKQDQFPAYNQKFTSLKFIRLCVNVKKIFVYREKNYWELYKKKKRYDWMILFWLIVPFNVTKKFISQKVVPSLPRPFILFLKNIVYPKQKS